MIYLLGAKGFVGSAIQRYLESSRQEYIGITREKYRDYIGHQVDCLINAAGSGTKWKANQEPRADFERNVKPILDFVFDFKYRIFIHISSVDVYSDTDSLEKTREESVIDITKLQAYGFNRYLAELVVRWHCPKWLILRLGGLVGPNLKKNPVYDWTHHKPFTISPKSKMTFIHTETVAEIIGRLIDKGVTNEIINVTGSDSIELQDLPTIYKFEIKEPFLGELPISNYHINVDKLKAYFPVRSSRLYIEKYIKEDLV